MLKKTLIITSISIAICGFFQLIGVLGYIAFPDKLFVFSLVLLVVGGFSLLNSWNFFTLQKYAFQRMSKKIPFFSSLFMTANARSTQNIASNDDDDDKDKEDEPEDYAAYLKKHSNDSNAKDSLPYLFSFAALAVMSVLINLIF